VNFGRRWRVPKLVLAIPGSAEFLARAPGVWQKRTAIIKARFPSPLPLLNPPTSHPSSLPRAPALPRSLALSTVHFPCRVSRPAPRLVASRLASPRFGSCCCRVLARSRSSVRSVLLRRVVAYPPSTVARFESERGDRWRASARVERKKSAGLTTGDGRRGIDRANIGDQESARSLRGYNRDAAAGYNSDGYYRPTLPRINDADSWKIRLPVFSEGTGEL